MFDKDIAREKFYREHPEKLEKITKCSTNIPHSVLIGNVYVGNCYICDVEIISKSPYKKQCRKCFIQKKVKYNYSRRINNPKKYRDYQRQYQSSDKYKKRRKLYNKKYFKSESYKILARKRDATRRLHCKEKLKRGDWEKLKELYDFTCLMCGKKEPDIKLTQDHVIPVSRGGRHVISNIQPLCIRCNCSKFTKTIDFRHKSSV